MTKVTVAVLGASGETGHSITNALLDKPDMFSVVLLVRPQSAEKPINKDYVLRGASLREYDLNKPEAILVDLLTGIDIIVSAISVLGYEDQIPIAKAGVTAGVKRFIPSAWSTVTPPTGVTELREIRGRILNKLLALRVPYTYVEAGWWFPNIAPKLSSGRTDYLENSLLSFLPRNLVPGDGNVLTALTDIRDIGQYVVRIILDERTLNRMVFIYSATLTLNEALKQWEQLSGESFDRNFVSASRVEEAIAQAKIGIAEEPDKLENFLNRAMYEYFHSWGVRGDNTPESAKYLGYLIGEELYPDLRTTTHEQFVQEALAGKARVPIVFQRGRHS